MQRSCIHAMFDSLARQAADLCSERVILACEMTESVMNTHSNELLGEREIGFTVDF